MTDKQKQLLLEFYSAQLITLQSNQQQFATWLLDFFFLTKDEQKQQIVAWLDDRKNRNNALIATLDAQKIAQNDRLVSDNNLIDGLKTKI